MRHLRGLAAALSLAAALAAACQHQAARPPTSDLPPQDTTEETPSATAAPAHTNAVARVNGVAIPRERLDAELEDIKKSFEAYSDGVAMPEDYLKSFEAKLIARLVNQELIAQHLKSAAITITDAEVEESIQREISRRPGGEEQFMDALKRSGLTLEQAREEMRSGLALQKFLNKDKDLDVTDAEIKAYYDEHKADFTTQERVEASHILFKVGDPAAGAGPTDAEARKKADSLYKIASRKGADFAKLASEHSEDPASQDGSLGSFVRGQMVQEFEDAAFAAKVGVVTRPIKTRFGYHLIKVAKKEDAGQQPLEEVKDQIKGRIEARKFEAASEKLLNELRAQATVELL